MKKEREKEGIRGPEEEEWKLRFPVWAVSWLRRTRVDNISAVCVCVLSDTSVVRGGGGLRGLQLNCVRVRGGGVTYLHTRGRGGQGVTTCVSDIQINNRTLLTPLTLFPRQWCTWSPRESKSKIANGNFESCKCFDRENPISQRIACAWNMSSCLFLPVEDVKPKCQSSTHTHASVSHLWPLAPHLVDVGTSRSRQDTRCSCRSVHIAAKPHNYQSNRNILTKQSCLISVHVVTAVFSRTWWIFLESRLCTRIQPLTVPKHRDSCFSVS